MRHRLAAAPLAIALALLAAAPASATTFCVPGFHAACPNSGGNVAQANLEAALAADGSDGVADKVIVAAGTYTDPDSLGPGGIDPLEIVGAGSDTVLTTSSTGNIYVVNLNAGSRSTVTLRNVRIVAPASLPDGLGAALQTRKGTIDNIDVEIRNPGTDAIAVPAGATIRDSRIYATGAGTVGYGIGATRPRRAP